MNTSLTKKIPVIAVMGHIDHGKSTLLSYIRQSNKPLNEAGGITQHISTYEIQHKTSDGKVQPMTFLDTPGHEAFSGIRTRGARIADIAILVVSAEDGVKPQTLEALRMIHEAHTPFVVAMTKIDKPDASIERTKLSLAENEIYVEGYGGTVSAIPVSAKTGAGIPELLDMITLLSDLEELAYNEQNLGTGYILESNLDVKKGVSATCIITDGSISKGGFIVSGESIAPIRIMENFEGKPVEKAVAGQGVRIVGFDTLPQVGNTFVICESKKDALDMVEHYKTERKTTDTTINFSGKILPLVIKADAGGTLEAVLSEVKKLDNDRIKTKVIYSGIGTITEGDIKIAYGTELARVIGFSVKVDGLAKATAERIGVSIHTFDIIYKLSEWLEEVLKEETPSIDVEEVLGVLKVLKVFSKVKDKQIIGGLVESGTIGNNSQIKLMRRDTEIGSGKIRELQSQKIKVDTLGAGKECGLLVEAKVEIAPGDRLHAYIVSKK